MKVNNIYTEDLHVAQLLIKKDNRVTRQFFYQQCYPLFKSIYDNYFTDCSCCKEFIDEIYVVVLSPSKQTGRCQMENFKGESSLASWLKSACLFYCYSKYRRKRIFFTDETSKENCGLSDRLINKHDSYELDMANINRYDVQKVLSMMENERYRNIIRLFFIEEKSNEETAEMLNMTMSNYYNKKKLAINQFKEKLKEEASYE